nr:MAG TPA: hypothetical protein [Bacteriophage sp.]
MIFDFNFDFLLNFGLQLNCGFGFVGYDPEWNLRSGG